MPDLPIVLVDAFYFVIILTLLAMVHMQIRRRCLRDAAAARREAALHRDLAAAHTELAQRSFGVADGERARKQLELADLYTDGAALLDRKARSCTAQAAAVVRPWRWRQRLA